MIEPIAIPDATLQPAEYVKALLDTLGDRDPLAVYEQTSSEVQRLCQDLDEAAWSTPMASGEWSALQIVGHLFDVDVVYGFRWRLVLTEAMPSYPGYNEKGWSRLARPMPQRLLEIFAGLREANVTLMRSLGEPDWKARGVHGEQGSEDVRRMLDKIAGHDLAHLNQLQRTIAAARESA